MLFNSYIFVLFFLPLCIIGYFLLNYFKKYKLAQLYLLCMSLWFYAYFNYSYLLIILISIGFNYCLYKFFEKVKYKKVLLALGLAVNIGSLIYFKYMDFFISNINYIFHSDWPLLHIVLPLGISFFTFQQLSFVIDSYRKEVPKYDLITYASFVAFFPQLVAGPIVTHDELVPQFMDKSKKKLNFDNLAKGIYIFAIGLAKKVLIADAFGAAVDAAYAIGNIDTTNAIILMLSYTFQIYFDFSGYSDMAIGIGKMFNVDLPINFNSPYKAITIKDFWNRWHMTLTRFFTKYVYIPLGGNRKGKIRKYINVMIVFIVSGLWHGANWTFILWGFLHGLFSIITQIFEKQVKKINTILNWIITFTFVNFTWIIFRADSIKDAFNIIKNILKFNFKPINNSVLSAFRLPELVFLLKQFNIEQKLPYITLQIFIIGVFVIILLCKNTQEKTIDFKPTRLGSIKTAILLVLCILSFSGVSAFLYFNF